MEDAAIFELYELRLQGLTGDKGSRIGDVDEV